MGARAASATRRGGHNRSHAPCPTTLVSSRFCDVLAPQDLISDEAIADAPILVLGNKIDLQGAAVEEELKMALGLQGQTTGKGTIARSELNGRPIELFMCTILRKSGYGDGFRWLSQYI